MACSSAPSTTSRPSDGDAVKNCVAELKKAFDSERGIPLSELFWNKIFRKILTGSSRDVILTDVEQMFLNGCDDMLRMNSAKKAAIIDFINSYHSQYGRTPAVHDISAGTGVANTTVHRYLVAMQESGELDYNGRRSIETTRTKKESAGRLLPVLGRVSCGPGDYEEENVREYIRMPESLIGKGDLFALVAKGHSMVDAGVHEGDYVIVRKQETAEIGDLVVALYDGGLNNLKKLCYDEQEEKYYLYSCNADQDTYAPIYVDELQIQGVAVSAVHSLIQG